MIGKYSKMINNKFLMISMASTLLVTTTFAAGTLPCVGGVCFVKLDNLKPSKGSEEKNEKIVLLENPRYIENYAQNENIDKSMTIVLDGETITVFPHSSYVMNEEALDEVLLAEPMVEIEDKILKKSNLPSSEYFCEKDKEPVYLNNDIFECV